MGDAPGAGPIPAPLPWLSLFGCLFVFQSLGDLFLLPEKFSPHRRRVKPFLPPARTPLARLSPRSQGQAVNPPAEAGSGRFWGSAQKKIPNLGGYTVQAGLWLRVGLQRDEELRMGTENLGFPHA